MKPLCIASLGCAAMAISGNSIFAAQIDMVGLRDFIAPMPGQRPNPPSAQAPVNRIDRFADA